MRRAAAAASCVGSVAGIYYHQTHCHRANARQGVLSAIGDTPLIELTTLSKLTGCKIVAKCEHLNPGGSIKDRAALQIIEDAERSGKLVPGYHDTIVEGTGGNTGIGLALVAAAKGYKCVLAMPASLAAEKIQTMKTLGAEVILTPGVPFQDPRHYFHVAAGLAHTQRNVFFTNQFENTNNAMAHYKGTAPEIWAQTGGDIDGFICSSGTGGTIGGCTKFLKERKPDVRCYLIDCEGSALHPYVAQGEGYIERGPSPSSGRTIYDGDAVVQYMERSKGSSICEGIGIDRKTANFGMSLLDGAMQGSDQEAVDMAYYLKEKEGIFVGPSAALNVVGAVKLARHMGPGHTICTVLCDGGDRYRSKIWSEEWLKEKGLVPSRRKQGSLALSFVGDGNEVKADTFAFATGQ